MKILVVEDDDHKRQRLVECIKAAGRDLSVNEARSLQGGLKSLRNQLFDFVVLDMTMTTFDVGPNEEGGRPAAFAGRDLLDYLKRRPSRPWAVVVTQYDRFGEGGESVSLTELDRELQTSYGQKYLGTVPYNASSESWKKALNQCVANILRSDPGAATDG